MIGRLFAIFIVVFWMTMTALLIRSEIGPRDSRLREIPVSHVIKLLFLHDQPSELNIYSGKLRVGHVRLHPHVRKSDGARLLDFSGDVQLFLPGVSHQRFILDGGMEMTRLLEVKRAQIGVNIRDAAAYRVEIAVDPPEHTGHYQVRAGDRVLDEREYSLDENGANDLLRQLEIDPMMIKMAGAQVAGAPLQYIARQASIDFRGDKIETYLVTIQQNDQTLAEIHVDQLGRIVRATTLLGYTFSPDDLVP